MSASTTGRGHHVLAVPIPALDPIVLERTAFYDPSFVSADPAFIHAHITLLAPWVHSPSRSDLDAVAQIAASSPSFELTLAELAQFPDGLIYLKPEPAEPLRRLTRLLTQAFPDYPPYGGAFGEVAPHLTLDRQIRDGDGDGDVTVAAVQDRLAHLLPVRTHAERIDLQWWANDDCHLVHSWPLGLAHRTGEAHSR